MSLIADFQQFVTDAEARVNGVTNPKSQYAVWAKANPGELARWVAFRDAIIAGQRPTAPTMLTPHGRELVDAGVLYLDATVAPTPPPAPTPTSYDTATAGIVPPAFTPTTPVITCRTPADIDAQVAALASLPATEYRQVVCAPGITYTDELFWDLANLPGSFTDPHVFWDWGTTKFAGSNICMFYGRDFNNVVMTGGDFTNSTGMGIFIARGHGFRWYDFVCHDCAADGLDIMPGFDKIGAFVMKGTLKNNGLVISGDPHAEKGTGIHASNCADDGHDFGDPTIQSTLALKILDQPTGAGVELGQSAPLLVQNLDLYLYADTIGLPLNQPSSPGPTWLGYAQSQTAGNLIQLWGDCTFKNIRGKYLEGHNLMGRVVTTNGVEGSTDMSGVVIEFARAFNCCLSAPLSNSSLGRETSPTDPYDRGRNVVYKDVA